MEMKKRKRKRMRKRGWNKLHCSSGDHGKGNPIDPNRLSS